MYAPSLKTRLRVEIFQEAAPGQDELGASCLPIKLVPLCHCSSYCRPGGCEPRGQGAALSVQRGAFSEGMLSQKGNWVLQHFASEPFPDKLWF